MPICIEVPPASISIAGTIVSISKKLWARARKPACHRKEMKFFFDIALVSFELIAVGHNGHKI